MLLPAVAAGIAMMGTQAETVAAPSVQPPLQTVQTLPGVTPAAPAPGVQARSPVASTPPASSEENPVEGGEIIVTGDKGPPPGDPLEDINAKSFEAVQAVDKAVVEPVAQAYNKGLPLPVRKGLRNFFSNLGEPITFAAYLLQLKPGKAFETAGRFGVNSTLGFLGLFDVAKRKPFFLPHRDNGLANTLGFYGIGPGPYMYLPVIGPTTVRDLIGDTVDKMILPFAVGKPFNKAAVVIPATILNQLGERAAFDETIKDIRKEDDPYTVYKDLYLKQRKAEIEALHGRVTEEPDRAIYGRKVKTAPDQDKVKKEPQEQ